MPLKLSEVAAKLGVKVDELIDDETGKPYPEVLKAMKENAAQYTQGQQKLKEVEGQYSALYSQAQAIDQHRQQLEARMAELQRAATERQEKVVAAGGDWRQDPYLAQMQSEFEKVYAAEKKMENIGTAVSKALVEFAGTYQRDVASVNAALREMRVWRMKSTYPDFDEEKVTEFARKNNIDDWERAYKGYQAENLPAREEEIRKQAREEARKEVEQKYSLPRTEMGGGPAPEIPAGSGEREGADPWEDLKQRLVAQGMTP